MSDKIVRYKPWSVELIISGGQTGADRAALDWAIKHNIPHSGWCPKGRLAEDGVIEPKYTLKETSSSVYEERTDLNVRDSDATVIFTIAPQLIKGSLRTLSCAKKYKKPWIHLVKLNNALEPYIQLLEFLQKHNVRVLNVAGSRESEESEVGNFVTNTLQSLYEKSMS
ncbi:MAG: putative molybdenum carrier protein [Nostoc sp. ChiQUE02]|uniref:putative molybdenum carrier protein n=1 Tax=Nostoc sp. ChiQUE02 TaxID=3075377 RepID=UPI002AD289A9|nr:putative molybdenum carrier protein [Nostoc sp. ChiQUE02]MDZ8231615.1 putative molybdenum carrier protein [Nostoc sp. ChiQUE02]